MKLRLLGLVLAGFMLATGPASAAILDVSGGTPGVLPSNFDPVNFPAGVTVGVTPITTFGSGDVGGLSLLSNAVLSFEFIGKEAGFTNTLAVNAINLFTNNVAPGTSTTRALLTGNVPFSFHTSGSGLTANNGGVIPAGLSIAFADLGNDTFLALFNDGGGGDVDFDDMVVKVSVSAVPLPAAIWLLLSAVVGLFSVSSIRRRGSQTA